MERVLLGLVVLALLLLVVVSGAASRFVAATRPPATPLPRNYTLISAPDGPIGSNGFRGVLVQRTTHFQTVNANDSIPDFDRQVYDTDGAWDPSAPDRITIPESWAGEPIIFTVQTAWAGHTDRWVELKLYCGAMRPIGNQQEDKLVGVVQAATNPDSPFVEMHTAPLVIPPGTACMIAFKTPHDRLLISYQKVTTLFGAYVP